jgi:hypothetical protein
VAASVLDQAPVAVAPPIAFAGAGTYAAHVEGLAAEPASPALLRHLLLHVEADLAAADRVALYRALWRCGHAMEEPQLKAAESLLDGRYRGLLGWMAEPIDAPLTIDRLAWAHSARAPRGVFAADAGFVLAWLAAQPATAHSPRCALVAVQARLALAPEGRLDATAAAELQRACLDMAGRDATLIPLVLCSLFELALAAGQPEAATDMLTECVRQGAHGGLAAAALRRWLEADAGWPLALDAALERQWLKPAALHDAAYRARLLASLSRPEPRARLQALDVRLGAGTEAAPSSAGFDALARLDRLLLDADSGLAVGALLPTITGLLAPVTQAALQLRAAVEAIDRAEPQQAAIALAAARLATGDTTAAALLQQLLLAIDEGAAKAAAVDAGLDAEDGWFGTDWQREAPLWRCLAERSHEHLRPLAAYQLALLYSDGCLQPCQTQKIQRLADAQVLWRALQVHPAYARLATERLAGLAMRLLGPAERHTGGRQHLWFDSPQPDAQRLLIVFSCVDSHHSYAQVPGLVARMNGHHLLFINNPELNWYSDAVFDRVTALIEQQVLPRFRPDQVSCYFGSMGGHAALKFALHFGFQAIVFNPQIDLRLWAAFRPQQRALLWAAQDHANVQQAPLAQFGRSPVYYLVGSSAADREAFSLWLQRLRQARHASVIVEKMADPHHAGLIGRAVPGGRVVPALLAIQQRLSELAAMPATPGQHAELPAADVERFWQALDQAATLKLEVLVRDGRVFVADSLRTGTLPMTAP